MNKIFLSLSLMFTIFLVGCGNNNVTDTGTEVGSNVDENEQITTTSHDPINVLSTFSIISDMVENVGGDLVNVTTIVPIGGDPHEHEVTPQDVINATEADVIFYNGLYLEIEYDWFEELMETAGRTEGIDFFAVTDGIPYYNLRTEGMEEYYDPHAWMDPIRGMEYVNNIAAILSDIAPWGEEYFIANAQAYNEELNAIYTEWEGRFDNIIDDQNLLITTEGAFRYFGSRFGVNNDYLWEINSEDEGSPAQFIRLIDIVNSSNVPYLFLESTIDPDFMEQVSQETGVPIFDEYLFTDSLSDPNGPAATYLDLLNHNLETIYEAFTTQ